MSLETTADQMRQYSNHARQQRIENTDVSRIVSRIFIRALAGETSIVIPITDISLEQKEKLIHLGYRVSIYGESLDAKYLISW